MLTCESLLKGSWDFGKIRHQGSGFAQVIILAVGDKVEVFPDAKAGNIGVRGRQSVISGDTKDNRQAFPQCGFNRHSNAGVCDAVIEFGQGVAGTGRNHQSLNHMFGAEGVLPREWYG